MWKVKERELELILLGSSFVPPSDPLSLFSGFSGVFDEDLFEVGLDLS